MVTNDSQNREGLKSIKLLVEAQQGLKPKRKRRILALLDGKEYEDPKFLTTAEAAKVLGCHPVTLKRWGREGKINPIRFSKRLYRWRGSDIYDLLHNGLEV